MKTNIIITFKDNKEHAFDANVFTFNQDGFCYLDFYSDENEYKLVACVLSSEIKYLKFVEVEDENY